MGEGGGGGVLKTLPLAFGVGVGSLQKPSFLRYKIMVRDFMSTDRGLPAASEAVLPTAAGRLTAPGFRFCPTDEELISYYLKTKVQGKPIALDPIGEVDVYKQEDPFDLPGRSKIKTKERAWFFFTILEKYEKSGYAMRSTNNGYWRQRGVGKKIKRGGDGQVVGNVKRLVFYTNNQSTNWVIHEYQLVDNDGHGLKTNAYVLCRLSDSSGSINAPFSEQEWDDADNEKIQQESNSRSMDLFDLNELPREFEIDDDDSKAVDQDDNYDACLLPCVLNKEAPLPFIRYRRKRQLDSDNSIQTTPKTTSGSIPYVAALLERSEPAPVDTTMVVPTEELIKDLQKERQQIAVERKRYKLEMTNAEMTISDLVGKNDALRMEIEELKKKNSNKEQCS